MKSLFDMLSPPYPQMVHNTVFLTSRLLQQHKRPLVSVSGGSDSDIMVDLVCNSEGGDKVTFVFFDTGIEYQATHEHLIYLEQHYGIKIHRKSAKVPVPAGCRQFGVPFLSKFTADMLGRLQRHGFDWKENQRTEIKQCKAALKYWNNEWGEKSSFNIKNNLLLKEFMIANPPTFLISDKCCEGAKKAVAKMAIELFDTDLELVGVRQAEGGKRASSYNSCFSDPNDKRCAQYRPLFFWTDKDKSWYKAQRKLRNSDCYEVYGMKRTGCAGCPFNSFFERELRTLKKYEPKLYLAANNIFHDSYDYTRKYREFKRNNGLDQTRMEGYA